MTSTSAQGDLILPRVEVIWGDVTLTSPTAAGENVGPLVYDVRVALEDQGQTPTGSMKWNPFGPAYAVYEKCVKSFIDRTIAVTFYYIAGKAISFEFYWGGQTETYGKEMEINVKLVTLLDGLMNANFFAAIQADKEEKGKTHKESVAELETQYGIGGLNLIRYTNQAKKDMSESIVKHTYTDGSTFVDAVQNLVKDNGNFVFFNNIDTANATVYTPYSHEERPGVEPIVIYPGPTLTNPDPTKRYGYYIGPGIIQSFTRNFEWQPPQKSQEINSILARKAETERDKKRKLKAAKDKPDKDKDESKENSPSTPGIYQRKTSVNTMSENNEKGPRKMDIFTKERAAKLSLSTLMCPSLTGIKPLDIIFIPAYSGDYIEDWIVTSIEYQQTQGGVDVAIQATRILNDSSPMSPPSSAEWQARAESLGLVPKNDKTLENWIEYAWNTFLPPGVAPSAGVQSESTVNRSDLDGGVRREFDNLNEKYKPLPVNSVAEQVSTGPGQVGVKVKDEAYFVWLTRYAQAGSGVTFDSQTATITGTTVQQVQNIYTQTYLQYREQFLLEIARDLYVNNR